MGSKIYIDEEVGYLEAWEALVHLTDDWICGGNVSHETIMNMRDVIAELRGELAEYVERIEATECLLKEIGIKK